MHTVADTIYQQLGDNQFAAMVGCAVPMALDNGLQVRFAARSKNGANVCRIELNGKNLYDLKFFKIRNITVKEISCLHDVGAEDLRRVFTEETGLRTSLSIT